MFSGTLYRLNAQGKLVLYHDYRLGTARDWSSKGNHGAFGAGTYWSGDGVEFDRKYNGGTSFIAGPHGYVLVADTASLTLTNCTIFAVGWPHRLATSHYIVDKRNTVSGAVNYSLRYSSTYLTFEGADGNSSLNTTSHRYFKTVACTINSGSAALFYVDGAYIGTGANARTLSASLSDLTIGSKADLEYGFSGVLYAVAILNVSATAAEISALHSELVSW